jgi:hypothetical protein
MTNEEKINATNEFVYMIYSLFANDFKTKVAAGMSSNDAWQVHINAVMSLLLNILAVQANATLDEQLTDLDDLHLHMREMLIKRYSNKTVQ